MPVRGIRGATTADANTSEAIVDATEELLRELVAANNVDPAEVAFAYFSTTSDLDADFPAYAARGRLGWVDVPMLCGHEMEVPLTNPRAVARCVRCVLLYNTDQPQSSIRHVYLRGAKAILANLTAMRNQLEKPS